MELVKVDTDVKPAARPHLPDPGDPGRKGVFKDGAVISEFVGAQPGPAVAAFLDSLLPNEADGLVASGDEDSLREALELDPTRADAAVPLARILLSRGEADAAAQLLRDIPGSFAADGLLARIELEAAGTPRSHRRVQRARHAELRARNGPAARCDPGSR